MGERKLFYAKGVPKDLIHIDKLTKEQHEDMDYFCPFCGERVIPRLGEQKIWHFAHLGPPCNMSQKYEYDYKKLDQFMKKKTISIDDVRVPQDSREYQCLVCNRIGSKRYGKRVAKNIYVCNDCFKLLSPQELQEIENKGAARSSAK